MVNSGQFNKLPSQPGIEAVSDFLEEKGWGGRTVTYKLRDWLISRQRYWGVPIPMIYCPGCGIVPVPEKELPVLLPEDAEFKPPGESPLKYHEQFVNTTCPQCGIPAKRETDTMDTFMCSSWYFLRYASPNCDTAPFDADQMRYWLPVDLYTGGAEHAVMHLFYARFFVKAIHDMGLVDFDEPFTRLFNQGIIIAEKQKMSKSRGNVVTPDEYVSQLGADTVRAYLMFVAPGEQGGGWEDRRGPPRRAAAGGGGGARSGGAGVASRASSRQVEALSRSNLSRDQGAARSPWRVYGQATVRRARGKFERLSHGFLGGGRARRASTASPDLPVIPPRSASGQTVEPPGRTRTERLYLSGICSRAG